jgi:hypothetical protein
MMPRTPARLAWGALGAALLLAASGCGDAPPATDASDQQTAPAGDQARRAELRFSAGRVSLTSEQVVQLVILEDLAQQAGFELVVGPVEPRSITLRLDDVPLLDAISMLLEGVPFRAEYRAEGPTGPHALARLVVGEPRAAERRRAGGRIASRSGTPVEVTDERRREVIQRMAELRRRSAPERAEAARTFREKREAREHAALEQLASPDAAGRIEALDDLDAEGEALPRIVDLARTDPDAGVRAAAVARLADAGSFRAQAALLDALADPSPQVVIAALGALEDVGDESMLAQIEPLATHADPAVREAANETLESLR